MGVSLVLGWSLILPIYLRMTALGFELALTMTISIGKSYTFDVDNCFPSAYSYMIL